MSAGHGAGALVHDISITWLGTFGGLLAIFGVVAAPITTGDTALRSARLIAADFMRVDQKPKTEAPGSVVALFAMTFGLMMIDFNVLWRYFAWSNQTLAVFTLWACTVYLCTSSPDVYDNVVAGIVHDCGVGKLCVVCPVARGFWPELWDSCRYGCSGGCAVMWTICPVSRPASCCQSRSGVLTGHNDYSSISWIF